MKPRRPLGVTLLVLVVLTVAGVNLARFAMAVQEWQFLVEWLPISPAYLTASGLIWGVLGLLLAWSLWRGWPRAPWAAAAYFLAYSAYFWIDRLFLPGYPEKNANWPFAASFNLFVLAWTAWVLTRAKAKRFFGEQHEQESQDTTSA
jgi:hypothetical protein